MNCKINYFAVIITANGSLAVKLAVKGVISILKILSWKAYPYCVVGNWSSN